MDELKDLIRAAWDAQTVVADKAQQLKIAEEAYKDLAGQILTFLENTESDGTVVDDIICTRETKEKISISSDPDERKAFFEYLKSIEMFDPLISVHHSKLNSFYEDQKTAAGLRGEEVNIPGLNPPFKVSSVKLSRMKKKK